MKNLPQSVTIVGAGAQSSILAFRSLVFGREVCVFDISEEASRKALEKMEGWLEERVAAGRLSSDFAHSVFVGLTFVSDLNAAVRPTDLVIENVPEFLELKQKVWADIDEAAPEKTLLTTNSSSLKASQIGKFIKRKDKTYHLNFMTPTKDDMVEVMWSDFTPEDTKE